MQQWVVISGKGGTGKTSILASLAAMAESVVLADCDVDAPNLHLLATPDIEQRHDFTGGSEAWIEEQDCIGCGNCADACPFDAIHERDANTDIGPVYRVDPMACEGCGVCVETCPIDLVHFEPIVNGQWFVSDTRFGPMVHARLHPGEENTGKLVTQVREAARQKAQRDNRSLILIDGPPGIGCPVIASLAGADLALVVAEPSVSGAHDAMRVMQLARQMRVPIALCVNRWDRSPQRTKQLESSSTAHAAAVVGRVRDDPAIVAAQRNALALTEQDQAVAGEDIRSLWDALTALTEPKLKEPMPCQS
jgi:MinD superfamily P-loop ATPase